MPAEGQIVTATGRAAADDVSAIALQLGAVASELVFEVRDDVVVQVGDGHRAER